MDSDAVYCVDTEMLAVKMKGKHLNIRELADFSGVSRGTITNIFKGKQPSGGIIINLSTALDLSAQEVTNIFFSKKLTRHVN